MRQPHKHTLWNARETHHARNRSSALHGAQNPIMRTFHFVWQLRENVWFVLVMFLLFFLSLKSYQRMRGDLAVPVFEAQQRFGHPVQPVEWPGGVSMRALLPILMVRQKRTVQRICVKTIAMSICYVFFYFIRFELGPF